MSKKLQKYWYQRGVKAGKTDGWMNLEETLAEDLEQHPEMKSAEDLVTTGCEGWEATDHFNILYGSKMSADATAETEAGYLNEEALDSYSDYKSEFWEGYLAGRQKIGRDIYKLANQLLDKRLKRTRSKSRSTKRSGSRVAQASLKGFR